MRGVIEGGRKERVYCRAPKSFSSNYKFAPTPREWCSFLQNLTNFRKRLNIFFQNFGVWHYFSFLFPIYFFFFSCRECNFGTLFKLSKVFFQNWNFDEKKTFVYTILIQNFYKRQRLSFSHFVHDCQIELKKVFKLLPIVSAFLIKLSFFSAPPTFLGSYVLKISFHTPVINLKVKRNNLNYTQKHLNLLELKGG